MFFSAVVKKDLVGKITDMLGFKHVHDLGHYLRVSLLHQRIIKGALSFLVDRVRRKLSSWEAKKLSFAGRVTLAQSVLLSIPSYLMQSLMVSKGVYDEIEGWCDNSFGDLLVAEGK